MTTRIEAKGKINAHLLDEKTNNRVDPPIRIAGNDQIDIVKKGTWEVAFGDEPKGSLFLKVDRRTTQCKYFNPTEGNTPQLDAALVGNSFITLFERKIINVPETISS